MSRLSLLFDLVFLLGCPRAQAPIVPPTPVASAKLVANDVCDFRLQSCIHEGEMISTTWGGSSPNICYTRSGDSLIPDPCKSNVRHVEPSAEYLESFK